MKRLLLSCLIILLGCETQISNGDGWKVAGRLSDSPQTQFIEITQAKLQDRATYDSAISALCRQRNACILGFFAPGDRIPKSISTKEFYSAGGWANYPVVAFWFSSHFTKWDCTRAGSQGAPLDAFCGPGVKEAYSALLSIGGRAGMAKACSWTPSDGPKVALEYIDSIADPARRNQFQQGYERNYASGLKGPNNPEDCRRLREKIDKADKSSMLILKQLRK